jgi:DNA-binding response OmpR family regulator
MTARILIAMNDPFDLQALQALTEAAGFRTNAAASGRQVLDLIAREQPHILVLDFALVDGDSAELLKVIQRDSKLRHIPVLAVVDEHDESAKEQSIASGAVDYITKPFRAFDVSHRLRGLRRRRGDSNQGAGALKHAAAHDASSQDPQSEGPVTQEIRGYEWEHEDDMRWASHHSRQLQITLNYECMRSLRYGHPLSCMVVRWVNYHDVLASAGKQVTEDLAHRLISLVRNSIRALDQLFWYSRSELIVLLPDTDVEGTTVVRSRLDHALGVLVDDVRSRASGAPDMGGRGGAHVELQLGISTFSSTGTAEALVRTALQSMKPVCGHS